MASERFEASIVMTARDRLSDAINRVSGSLGGAAEKAGIFTRAIGRAAAGIGLFQAALIGLSAIIPAIITATTISSMRSYEDASRRARFQLRLMGLSAFETRTTIDTLSRILDRSTAVSLLGSADAMSAMTLAGLKLTERLAPLAEKLSDITGIRPDIVFQALVTAVTEKDFTPFLDLVAGTERLAPAIKAIEENDLPGLMDAIDQAISEDTISNVARLADNLGRIGLLTRPSREAVGENVAGFLNVLVAAFAERADVVKDNFALILASTFGASFVGAGRSLASRFATGFLAGLVVFLILDFANTLDMVFNNPEVVASLAVTAFVIGRTFGQNWVQAFIVGAALLLPGIIDTFQDMETSDTLTSAAFAAGFLLARQWRLGFLASLSLASILADAFGDLVSGGDVSDAHLKLSIILAAAVVGFAFGGPMGAVVGAVLAASIFDKLKDLGFIDQFAELGRSAARAYTAAFARVYALLLSGTLSPSSLTEWFIEQFAKVGKNAGRAFANAFIDTFTSLFNSFIESFGKWFSDIFSDIAKSFPKFGFDSFHSGGRIPGPVGAPRLISALAGETVLPLGSGGPTGQNQGPMVIHLIMDRKVIATAALDAFQREARLKANMVPGTLGS